VEIYLYRLLIEKYNDHLCLYFLLYLAKYFPLLYHLIIFYCNVMLSLLSYYTTLLSFNLAFSTVSMIIFTYFFALSSHIIVLPRLNVLLSISCFSFGFSITYFNFSAKESAFLNSAKSPRPSESISSAYL